LIFGLEVVVQLLAAALSGAMKIAVYPTDLTDAQWQLLEKLLPKPKPKRRGRPRTPLRQIVNALRYVVKPGCHWRLLPQTFPPWQTVKGS
jgi:transposase